MICNSNYVSCLPQRLSRELVTLSGELAGLLVTSADHASLDASQGPYLKELRHKTYQLFCNFQQIHN